MGTLFDLVKDQLHGFHNAIGANYDVGMKLPGQVAIFVPTEVEDYSTQTIILHGNLSTGEKSRVIFDCYSFPLVLVAHPIPQPDQPRRPIGFSTRTE